MWRVWKVPCMSSARRAWPSELGFLAGKEVLGAANGGGLGWVTWESRTVALCDFVFCKIGSNV